jgi:hypothetical protein
MWADRGVKKIFPQWNQFVDAIFFEKQRIFDCAFGLFACVSVHSNDLQHLLFQCASHIRCATPVVNCSWLILDGITAASADGIAASWPGGKFVQNLGIQVRRMDVVDFWTHA